MDVGTAPGLGEARPQRGTYAGLFAVTLATLMYEILLTRIFSVSMWYHFAFMAISIAMFGASFGAILVYLAPSFFAPERTGRQLAATSLGFALGIPISFAAHLALPFVFGPDSAVTLAATYAVISVPFVFSGICVCLALTRFPTSVGRLYAADLLGAALGCVLLVQLIDTIDGPSAVLAVAATAGVGSWCFAGVAGTRRLPVLAATTTLGLGIAALGHAGLAANQTPLLQLFWVKGARAEQPLYETWNALSRVTVHGDPRRFSWPVGWGLSSRYRPERPIRQLQLLIDAHAGTVLTAFDGDRVEPLEHLKYDISNLAHRLRSGGDVFVIGVGGGRDVLSSLLFGQERIVAVDLNHDILDIVNRRFGEFTGHLDRNPRVTFVHDEARSYLGRSDERFDVVQASLVDTFTASAAGAYMLSEHSVYTAEAWTSFLEHLTPRGILTFSRFYIPGLPGETHRLVALAAEALRRTGVEEPRAHIVLVKNVWKQGPRTAIRGAGGSTILVSPSPFSAADLDRLDQAAEELDFRILVSPRTASDPTFEVLASGRSLAEVAPNLPVDMSAPTDDRPFFFFMLKPGAALSATLPGIGRVSPGVRALLQGISVLVTLLWIVVGLTFVCIVVPLWLTSRRGSLRGGSPFLVYFAAIGTGFMLVEISQLQRLSLFLGHPTYGLSVVLFSILLASGLGSWTVQPVEERGVRRGGALRLVLLLAVLAALGLLTPPVAEAFRNATTAQRIAVSVALLLPMGFCMGMALPLGLRLASLTQPRLTAWLWGINGATSVCASVIAVILALSWGITATYWLGVACYVFALAAFLLSARSVASAA